MSKRNIVVIGASAGGVYALKEFVDLLPADFSGSIFVVQHMAADALSSLPEILNFRGKLKACHPVDGDPIRSGRIFVAPPDHHLLIEKGRILVKKGPKENRFRPSIDALFRSAAYNYGPRVIGIVLTGLLNDGTSGMWTVKRLGGVSIIQQPQEALYPSMPESVRENVEVDYAVPIADLAPLLVELVAQEVDPRPSLSSVEDQSIATEIKIAEEEMDQAMKFFKEGQLTALTCPECHGSLVSIQEGGLVRYRCHTGHAFTAGSLLSGVNHTIEESLWNAIRALEELIMILNKLGQVQQDKGDLASAQSYFDRAAKVQERVDKIRPLVFE
ncbi:chemotaxis protein CheB [Spirosoma utsteinense]|uniref:protein-glutamate methylesterase n=1 Tax=Spirosoma utsteinense TaxID=2585773 RepID=A0ABR6WDN0_9BACT|nr:chemotaxis protein CheB [Spirosoma utsteinense]MBC3788361.1 two-component system chemotaxis response regulator CheB [Spirosoma utsteinense]MBC3794278.1 two-component system chemotaxis response regulator CheB [Spirosoma utsteinense]